MFFEVERQVVKIIFNEISLLLVIFALNICYKKSRQPWTISEFKFMPLKYSSIPDKTLKQITLQELNKGKIKQIYHRISYPVKRLSSQETFRWKLVNQNILPNYLKTFNYRTVRNLLPFNLDSGECALCLQFQDTAVHVFAKCSITRQIWSILQEVLNNITETSFPLDSLTPLNFHVPTKFEIFTESIALILTVTNYCIWQTRKKQLDSDHQKSNSVKPSSVLARIFNLLKTWEKKENSQTDKTNYEMIKRVRTEVGKKLSNLFK